MNQYLCKQFFKEREKKLRAGAMIIFFTVFTIIYGLVNSLIFVRGLQAIPAGSAWRPWFIAGFWIIASAFILARILEQAYPCALTRIITWVGSIWLGFLLYFVLSVVILDLLRLFNHATGFHPALIYSDYPKTKLILLITVVIITTVAVAAGFINARFPRIKELSVHIPKVVTGPKTLNLVMASDIHLGTIIAKRKANKLVETINSLHPDIVLFAGDIVDEDLAPVILNNLGANLVQIKSRLGVYGITGNHEYIGGAEPAVKYLSEHGIKILRDTSVLIDNRFYLVGRDDRDKPRFTGKPRKELAEIMQQVDRSYPVILMDHQPFNLDKSVAAGVDLQLSGHTHHGQVWPFSLITKAIYEISHGYKKIANTHVYVSNGFGTWGPPIRLGNRPEIVRILINFD